MTTVVSRQGRDGYSHRALISTVSEADPALHELPIHAAPVFLPVPELSIEVASAYMAQEPQIRLISSAKVIDCAIGPST